MNVQKLKEAEKRFLKLYPGGFDHPDMVAIGRKHKLQQQIDFAQDVFRKTRFREPDVVLNNMVKCVSRASMVSMFEKPKFRDFIPTLTFDEFRQITNGLKNFLHGNQEKGFTDIVDVLREGKLAKWSLMTIVPNYYHPTKEVFVKPTTAKGVISHFELKGIEYKPAPTWEFYAAYREQITEMKALVDSSLSPNNAAFGGFLMMSSN